MKALARKILAPAGLNSGERFSSTPDSSRPWMKTRGDVTIAQNRGAFTLYQDVC